MGPVSELVPLQYVPYNNGQCDQRDANGVNHNAFLDHVLVMGPGNGEETKTKW